MANSFSPNPMANVFKPGGVTHGVPTFSPPASMRMPVPAPSAGFPMSGGFVPGGFVPGAPPPGPGGAPGFAPYSGGSFMPVRGRTPCRGRPSAHRPARLPRAPRPLSCDPPCVT